MKFTNILFGAFVLIALIFTALVHPEALNPQTLLVALAFGGTCFMGLVAELSPELKSALNTVKDAVHEKFDALKGTQEKFDSELIEVRNHVTQLRKSGLARGGSARPRGGLSDEARHYLGALAMAIGLRQDKITGKNAEIAQGLCKNILGAEFKTALTSSDISLPVEYGNQVVELVSEFGAARRYGTVVPLGAAPTKLPRLKTDPTFGLIAQSAAVTEKSPQTEYVTFTPEKFGGLIRLPSEIEEDSAFLMGDWLGKYAARQLAYVEDWNYFRSTGAGSGLNGSVKGLCESTIDNSKVVALAATGTAYSDATLAKVREVRSIVDAPVYGAASYYMHPSFEALLSTFNTAGNRPYNPLAQISPSGANGFSSVGPTLDGFPIRWVDAMPAYSTSANASKVFMLFGDLSYQYLGVRGLPMITPSREAAFEQDEILIRALERLTIGLMATGSVAGLQTAAS